MFVNWDAVIALLLPAVIVALALGYLALRRYFEHKERMAMIEQGLVPSEAKLQDSGTTGSSPMTGVMLTVVGLAVTLGLMTIGIGPWLLAGLVPAAIGIGLLIAHYLQEGATSRNDQDGKEE